MKFHIEHESTGRIRIQVCQPRMTLEQADLLEAWLQALDQVSQATVHERTCCAVIRYRGARAALLETLSRFSYRDKALERLLPVQSGRALNREYEERLVGMACGKVIRSLFFPTPLRIAYTVWKSVPYLLEEWTHKKSVDDLARSMSLNIDRVWLRTSAGEVLTPLTQVKHGDRIAVHMGGVIPLDGVIEDGEVMVNQASLTGESIPAEKRSGTAVYAGTVVEEGECVVRVTQQSGGSRYDKIVDMIEQSERLKSTAESQASRLADKLVPYTLAGSALAYLLTRNVTRALSVLMVDFSCALKLSMPLAVLSAMREAGGYHATVKGGKYLEAVAKADTIIFDKTGTLTYACPVVDRVIPFGGRNEADMLRLAACLEEHFPHSMANAVVRAAQERDLSHEEMHAQVEYLVAHGIASKVGEKRVVIGSAHFVFGDEGCTVPPGQQADFDALPPEFSHLYLAIGGELAAVICIADPLRAEADDVISTLRKLGIRRTVMLTGDSERTAAAIAAQVGVDEYHAEVLPEDKARFVEAEQAAGHTVIMLGDGINDSPALSAADVGIAISDGAAIAREIADITIAADNLFELVSLRMIAASLLRRIRSNYRFVIGFNGGLIGLGAAGVLAPATSAMLHNLSTLAISLGSMTNLLGQVAEQAEDSSKTA